MEWVLLPAWGLYAAFQFTTVVPQVQMVGTSRMPPPPIVNKYVAL